MKYLTMKQKEMSGKFIGSGVFYWHLFDFAVVDLIIVCANGSMKSDFYHIEASL